MGCVRPTLNYPEDVVYGERFSGGDGFDYRFVTLPKMMYLQYRKLLTEKKHRGSLPLLEESEWRDLGLIMSVGWVHHMIWRREPNILCFRRHSVSGTDAVD
eukprot:Gregarina_sp_Poly_1__2656@NODE_1724_length_3457_cov_21_558702_g908_i2_p3_GENE_NODE_1724_length_3457_cov_21_558702_g908_i2NODE_1724_length_3457_cov_21_558702_g908_i2_p3_ORF_typecomplete_len101_score10_17CKS/PF01111_19/2_5e18PH_8/PF15409_6/0_024_NODE_1724_length_3457_cov_21_558702_g908_i211651467